jgi:hypothetical protein
MKRKRVYLTRLRLHSVHERTIHEYGTVGGMRIGGEK